MRGHSRSIHSFPTLLRVGFSEMLAWRAEFLIWVLAYTMPLIMLALWSAVAREAPVGRFDEQGFRAYFLFTLVFRMLAASWVVWEMNEEIREGRLTGRLLRPISPLVGYAAHQLSAFPIRIVLATPIFLASLAWLGTDILTDDPVQGALVPLAIAGSWCMTFFVMLAIGSLALTWESALGILDLWMGLYFVFSGYLMPLELFPAGMQDAVNALPFRYMLSFPVESALGLVDRGETLRGLAVQWAYVAAFATVAVAVWRRGLKRYGAFGG